MKFSKAIFMTSVATTLSVIHPVGMGADQDEDGDALKLAPIEVSGEGGGQTTEQSDAYTTGSANTATKLNLSPRETPQSVSVITRAQMDDFGQTSIHDALENTTGVTVEKVETDRTYYTARGFEITNFQFDGIGLPLVYDNIVGDMDTAIFDRIEVVRGATGLMSGPGNPSAAVNFIRKRPTWDRNAAVDLTLGSYDNRRVEADVAGPVSESGRVRARSVVAYQDADSYLDRYSREKKVLYGVIEGDLTDSTLLTLGHAYQASDADSPLWGALPLYRTDGSATDYDVSTSTSADWAYWDGETNETFLELSHWFSSDWQGKAVLTRREQTSDSELFYVYGTPNPETQGSDLYAYPSQYEFSNEQYIADVYASGPFTLAGRVHELVVGGSWSRSEIEDESNYGQGIGTEIPHLEDWNGNYPKPAFDAGTEGSSWTDKQAALYSSARFSITDDLSALAGARVTQLDSDGETYGVSQTTSYDNVVTPYAGIVYDVSDNHSVYASYTEIFKPQSEVDRDRKRLDPVDGINYEAGFKSEFFNKRLNASVAVFRTRQNNLAEPAGTFANSQDTYYSGEDGTSSSGYEVELSGEVAPGLQLMAGYTYVDIEDKDGNHTRTYVPKNMVRILASYRVPAMQALKVGASVNWQDDIFLEQGEATTGDNAGSTIVTEQDSYAIVNLMARYDFTDNLSATLNIYNLTDEKYLQSLYWEQGYYGAPRHADLTLSLKY